MRSEVVAMLERNGDHAREFESHFDDLQHSQRPEAVTVCCSDSRVLQDHMWGNDVPGRLFTCSNIGNRVVQRSRDGDVVAGDVLYPVIHTGTEVIVVVGHTGCGAITAAYEDLTTGIDEPDGIAHCLSLLEPHLEPGIQLLPDGVDASAAVNRLVEYNVDRQVASLLESDTVPDGVSIIGGVYDFQDVYDGRRGEVHVINVDGERRAEVLRDDHPAVASSIDRLWAY